MSNVVIGVFSDKEMAEEAISELEAGGYNPKEMSLMMRDTENEAAVRSGAENVLSGTLGGAATGAVLGGVAGLAASFLIPGLGSFFIGGPLAQALGLTGAAATTVSGAATGALAGGIIGALTSAFGLSQEDAQIYERRINEGGMLLAVPAREGEEQEVMNILYDYGADNVRAVEAVVRMPQRAERIEERFAPAYFSEVGREKRGRQKVSQRRRKDKSSG